MTFADDRDERIMVQAADGKPHLLEILVRGHATSLLTFIHRMVGDRHRSEFFPEFHRLLTVRHDRHYRLLTVKPAENTVC